MDVMSKIVWWWNTSRLRHSVYLDKLAYRAWVKHVNLAFGKPNAWKLQKKYFPQ